MHVTQSRPPPYTANLHLYHSTSKAFIVTPQFTVIIPQLRIDEFQLTVCKHKKAVRNKKNKEQKQARTNKAFMTAKHFQ